MYLKHYLNELDYENIPNFLEKYLKASSLIRLKKVGYFCGMDYASNDIYNFKEYISRYDHSLTVSLLVYRLTRDKKATIAGLFHDIATPCFSHVIDYMNNDYEKQESTEEYTEQIIKNDDYLMKCFKEDNIDILDIVNFKKYTIVDNDRPKVCADRIDGVILTGIGWTKNINKKDISKIVNDLCIFKNDDNEDEIGFKSLDVALKVLEVSESIDVYCHSLEDNYMMQLLADITKMAIDKKYISYDDLYSYNEEELFNLFKSKKDKELQDKIYLFENMKMKDVPNIDLPPVKIRDLNPLVNGKRLKSMVNDISLNKKALKLKKLLNSANFYVVTDFDRTITKGNSMTSWAILSNTDLVDSNYIKERNELYDYYRPIETDSNISFDLKNKLMIEWFYKHLELFIKYELKEEVFENAIKDKNVMEFREGAKEYLEFLHKHNIPVIIISAGIGNFIEKFLKINNCYFDNIYIVSNYIKFKDGVTSIISNNIIHSLNKNECSFNDEINEKVKGREYTVLFGDQVEDIKMISSLKLDKTIKCGFLLDKNNLALFKENFDVLINDNTSFEKIVLELFGDVL